MQTPRMVCEGSSLFEERASWTLTLSDEVLRLPEALAEYVVCHELMHLRVPGHGKGWQAMMGAYLPD